MKRLLILGLVLFASLGCAHNEERAVPVNTNAPPSQTPRDININIEKGATDVGRQVPPGDIHVNVNNENPPGAPPEPTTQTIVVPGYEHAIAITGTESMYTATTPSGYAVDITPSPALPVLGPETFGVHITAPNNEVFPPNLDIKGTVKDLDTGAIVDAQWVYDAPGDATLKLNIPSAGTYLVDVMLNIGANTTDHAQFLMKVA